MTEHKLDIGRKRLGRQAWGNLRGAAGVRYGTTGRCSCGKWSWSTNNSPPSRGGRADAREAHAAHVVKAVEA